MTESMIERVARAISENIQAALPSGYSVDYDYAAQAAISAMREPTDRMLSAAETHDPEYPWYEPPTAWPKMIDAALTWPAGSADRAGVPLAKI